MATKAMIAKQKRLKKSSKFSARVYNRCQACGRPRAYIRKFGLCRICFRNLAHEGEIVGVKKGNV